MAPPDLDLAFLLGNGDVHAANEFRRGGERGPCGGVPAGAASLVAAAWATRPGAAVVPQLQPAARLPALPCPALELHGVPGFFRRVPCRFKRRRAQP